MVRTIKEHLQCMSRTVEMEETLQRFLLMYRSIPHSVTGLAPCVAMLGRQIRSLSSVNNTKVYAWNPSQNQYTPGSVIQQSGRDFKILMDNGQMAQRHYDQVKEVPPCTENENMTEDPPPGLEEVTNSPIADEPPSQDESWTVQRPRRQIKRPSRYLD